MERRNARFKLKSEETIVSIKTEKGWDIRMPQPLNVYLFLITLNILLLRFKKIKTLSPILRDECNYVLLFPTAISGGPFLNSSVKSA